MVKRKLLVINGQQYWANKEMPQEKKMGIVKKGFFLLGKGVVEGGKFLGKEIGKASRNMAENQKMQQQNQQQNPQQVPVNKEKKKQDTSFFSSGF
jgi:hypothetical protein